MSALKVLTQLVLRDLVKQKNLMLEFVGKAEEGIASAFPTNSNIKFFIPIPIRRPT